MKIIAQPGNIFRRIHDKFIMGIEINLGYDYSTGVPREDLPEYYEEILDTSLLPPTTEDRVRELVLLLMSFGVSLPTSLLDCTPVIYQKAKEDPTRLVAATRLLSVYTSLLNEGTTDDIIYEIAINLIM
jgi:hypothetical protein